MDRQISIIAGSLWGVALVVLGLWGWDRARIIVELFEMRRPEIALLAMRAAAVAALAGGQALMALLVVANVYRGGWLGRALGLSALVVCMVSVVCAVSLGLAGR